MRKYQPSNGTEGMIFTDTYCMNCLHCDPNPEGKKQCEILMRTMIYNVNDKEYPNEWVYLDDKPTCTKWQKWDWGNDGDPDDDNNPKAPIPVAPNQLMLFSVADEIIQNSDLKRMEAKNVRIGNIVSHRNKPRRIYQSHFHGCLIDYCKGLDIDESWILKCGFKKTMWKPEFIDEKIPEYTFDDGYNAFKITPRICKYEPYTLWLYDANIKHFKYVHELQNLFFAITGNEIELKDKR